MREVVRFSVGLPNRLEVMIEPSTGWAWRSATPAFNVVPRLDDNPCSVSLELGSGRECFAKAQVGCRTSGDDDMALRQAASFTRAAPLWRYHPLSFAARGTERNFLLEPLQSLQVQDEFYTVYLNPVTKS